MDYIHIAISARLAHGDLVAADGALEAGPSDHAVRLILMKEDHRIGRNYLAGREGIPPMLEISTSQPSIRMPKPDQPLQLAHSKFKRALSAVASWLRTLCIRSCARTAIYMASNA